VGAENKYRKQPEKISTENKCTKKTTLKAGAENNPKK